MNYAEFLELECLRGLSTTEATLRLWHHMYSWVVEKKYADTADSPEFVEYVCQLRNLSVQTINTHLRRMAEAGLLSRHVLRRKLPPNARDELLNPITNMFFGGKALPSTFARYCINGAECSLEFKSAARSLESVERRMNELREEKAR